MRLSVNASLWVRMSKNLFKLPRLLGEINDRDTQFTALVKEYQHILFIAAWIIVILTIFLTALTFTSAPKGTWRYGLCRIFLERNLQYPTHLRVAEVREYPSSARMDYFLTNAYGVRIMREMECHYNIDETGVKISRIAIDKKPLDKGRVDNSKCTDDQKCGRANLTIDEFNLAIPAILGLEELQYELPSFPKNIENFKIE